MSSGQHLVVPSAMVSRTCSGWESLKSRSSYHSPTEYQTNITQDYSNQKLNINDRKTNTTANSINEINNVLYLTGSRADGVPLTAVFGFQCALVVAAFVAVLLVLTLQHTKEFEEAVNENIRSRQANANLTLLHPFLLREPMLEQLAYRLKKNPSLRLRGDSVLSDVREFLEVSFVNCITDPLLQMIYLAAETSPRNWAITGAMGPEGLCMISVNGTGKMAVAGYPMSDLAPDKVLLTTAYPVDPDDFIYTVTRNKDAAQWHRPTLYPHPTQPGTSLFIAALSAPVANDADGNVSAVVALTADITEIRPTVEAAKLTTDTVAILIDAQAQYMMVSTDRAVPEFSPANEVWDIRDYPHDEYRNTYYEAAGKCRIGQCNYVTYERGNKIVSMIHITTSTRLSYHLLQITPRAFFYAKSEQSRAVGIAIGVVCALLVLATCVGAWLAINRPLSRLQESMSLSAQMRNEAANDSSGNTSPLLEIAQIQQAFRSMNQRLLLARPFLPQHLLLQDDVDEEFDEQGADEGTPAQRSRAQTPRSHRSYATSDGNSRHISSSVADIISAGTKERRVAMGLHALEARGPTYRKVGLICANLSDFHGLVTNSSTDQAIAAQAALAVIVEDAAQRERGLIDTFQGDHFVVSFNVARSSANIGRAAALCALHMSAAVGTEPLLGGRSMSMGFAAGRALVGNMGTGAMKRLCTVGPVYGEAVALERLARHVGQRCLVSERSLDGVEMAAYTLLLGRARLGRGGDMAGVRAIMMLAAAANDEWLYAMVQTASSNPYEACNAAMGHYLKGEPFAVPERSEEAFKMAATGIFSYVVSAEPHSVDEDEGASTRQGIEATLAPIKIVVDKAFYEVPLYGRASAEEGVRWAEDRVGRLKLAGMGYALYDLAEVAIPKVRSCDVL